LGDPVVIGRVERGRCLLDLRCVPPDEDSVLVDAVRAIRAEGTAETAGQ
jgi:L-seryl-tRNA(Ser) seleniumtransferase